MFGDQIAQAIDAAHGGRHLDEISRLLWRGWGEGQLTESTAQRLSDQLHARRLALNPPASYSSPAGTAHRPSIFPPRRPQRPPCRSKAAERRRRVAASGWAPPRIVARFTTAEQAALAIITDEVRRRGDCRLPVEAIAARAGVSRRSVQNALREAREARLIRVTERPRKGQPHLPNVVEIIAVAWRDWISKRPRRGRDRGEGAKPCAPRREDLRSERVGLVSDQIFERTSIAYERDPSPGGGGGS